jgi:sulfide:quinone oxidoreductase
VTRRVVVLGAGAGGLAAANRLARHVQAGADLEVVLVDRSGEHVFAPGYVAVMFGDAQPEAFRRPITDLARPEVRIVTGELATIEPDDRRVTGSFGELGYDELVVALGVDVGWPDGPPAVGELAPWTLAGALAGREALAALTPRSRVAIGVPGVGYRCPPAVLDLAVRIARTTGANVEVVHPWPRPLAPFGAAPADAAARLLADAGVAFHGEFSVADITDRAVTSADGRTVEFDAGLFVPPHRPPAVVAGSPLAGDGGWPAVTFPTFSHPAFPNVSVVGDLASTALKVGMAGTLAVFQAAHVADRIAASAGGPPASAAPAMSAICFLDTGETASFLHCDFTAPASGAGPAACTLMPWLPYFRRAKRLFADEWFATMLTGEVG